MVYFFRSFSNEKKSEDDGLEHVPYKTLNKTIDVSIFHY